MRDSKYLKENDNGSDAEDDAEADLDKDMFKKKTYKNSGKLAHSNKGFRAPSSGKSSFVRKRQRTN